MVKGFRDVLEASRKYEVTMRQAAMAVAVQKVAEAINYLGIWP
jgi:glutamate dehydrogenase/leucine dehydrogenase